VDGVGLVGSQGDVGAWTIYSTCTRNSNRCFKATSSALHSLTTASIEPKEQVCWIYLLYYSIAKVL